MKKHPILLVFAILICAGLVVGLSATDLWTYIIDFCKVGVNLFISWLNQMVLALRDALNEAAHSNSVDTGATVDAFTKIIF